MGRSSSITSANISLTTTVLPLPSPPDRTPTSDPFPPEPKSLRRPAYPDIQLGFNSYHAPVSKTRSRIPLRLPYSSLRNRPDSDDVIRLVVFWGSKDMSWAWEESDLWEGGEEVLVG